MLQIFYGDLVIKGNLFSDEIFANHVNLIEINNMKWNPNNWLSYSKSQPIVGSYYFDELHVNNLTVEDSYHFKGLIKAMSILYNNIL